MPTPPTWTLRLAVAIAVVAMVTGVPATYYTSPEVFVQDKPLLSPPKPPPSVSLVGPLLPGTRVKYSIANDGDPRDYYLYTPSTYDGQPAPLVVNIHPWLNFIPAGDELGHVAQAALSEMDLVAEERGFLVAYPIGYERSFGAGPICCPPANIMKDDVAYVRNIVMDAFERTSIDRTRVYSMGMSNGGYMSFRMACEMSDMFAAIAPSAASNPLLQPMDVYCNVTRPMPIIEFHGTLDTSVSYSGLLQTLEQWRNLDGCDPTEVPEVTFSKGDVECVAWTKCAPQQGNSVPTNVTLCTTFDGDHYNHPGSRIFSFMFSGTMNLDASREIADFFERYHL